MVRQALQQQRGRGSGQVRHGTEGAAGRGVVQVLAHAGRAAAQQRRRRRLRLGAAQRGVAAHAPLHHPHISSRRGAKPGRATLPPRGRPAAMPPGGKLVVVLMTEPFDHNNKFAGVFFSHLARFDSLFSLILTFECR